MVTLNHKPPFSRYRTQGAQKPTDLPNSVVGYGPNPAPYAQGVVPVGSHAGTFKSIHDICTPGFKKTRDPSKWTMNPLTVSVLVARAASGSATTSNVPDHLGRGLTRTWSGDGVGFIFGALVPVAQSVSFGSYPDVVNTDRLRQLAIIECLNRINPAAAQALVTGAEGRKTVDMILDRARKLANTWRLCRKGDLSKLKDMYPGKQTKRYPKRVVLWDENGQPIVRKNGKLDRRYAHKPLPPEGPKDPAERLWLEFRYGWSPLVHDIVDQLKAINAQYLRDDLVQQPFLRVLGRKSGDGTAVTQLSSPNNNGGSWKGTQTLIHKVEVKAYAKYRVVNQSGVKNRLNDFGAFDIPRYMWEVVPFSFVVDWFVPIGDWLGAITPKVGVEVIDSGVTVFTSKTVERVLESYVPSATGVGSWPSPPYPLGTSDGFKASSLVRSIGLPTPLLPVPEVNLNLKRLVDAAALFRSSRR